jgi:hypothetical protein
MELSMVKTKLALLAVALCSCATINVNPYIAPNFRPLVETFLEEGAARNVYVSTGNLTVVFGDVKDNDADPTVGVCSTFSDGAERIMIDREFWDSSDNYGREELLFHELGHCLLKRDHCNLYVNRRPVSIMNEYTGSSIYYEINRNTFIDELFSPYPGC